MVYQEDTTKHTAKHATRHATRQQPGHPGQAAAARQQPGRPGQAAAARQRPGHPGQAAAARQRQGHPGQAAAARQRPGRHTAAQDTQARHAAAKSAAKGKKRPLLPGEERPTKPQTTTQGQKQAIQAQNQKDHLAMRQRWKYNSPRGQEQSCHGQ